MVSVSPYSVMVATAASCLEWKPTDRALFLQRSRAQSEPLPSASLCEMLCSQPSVEQKQSTTDAAETVIADEMCSFAPIDSNDQSDAAVMIDKAIQSVVDSASRMEEPNDAEQFETASYLADWVTEQARMEKEADDRLHQAYLKSLHRQIKRPLRTAKRNGRGPRQDPRQSTRQEASPSDQAPCGCCNG